MSKCLGLGIEEKRKNTGGPPSLNKITFWMGCPWIAKQRDDVPISGSQSG